MAADINIRIGAKLDGLQRSIKKAQSQLSRFADFASDVGGRLSTNVTLPILGIGAAAVRSFAQFDRIEKGLEVFTGSTEAAREQFKRLNDAVNDTRTTLDLKTAAQGVQRLQSMGFSAENAENAIKQFGIAATASGASVDEVGLAIRQFGQILAKGKAEQEDFNSLFDNLGILSKVIQEEFGAKTAEDLRALGISMDEFVLRTVQAIESNSQLQSIQGGLAKAFESFTNAVQVGIRPLGEAIAKALNLEENLKRLSDFVTRTATAFSNLAPDLQRAIILFAGGVAALGPLVFAFGAAARVSLLFSAGLQTLSKSAGLLITPFTGIAKGVLGIFGNFRRFLGLNIEGKMLLLTRVFKNLAKVFNPFNLIVGGLVVGFTAAYTRSERFRAIVSKLVGQIKNTVLAVIGEFGGSLGSISEIGGQVIGVLAGLASAIVNLFSAQVAFIGGLARAVKRVATGDFQGAWDAIKQGGADAFGSLTSIITDFQKVYQETVSGVNSFNVETPSVTPSNIGVQDVGLPTVSPTIEKTAEAAKEVEVSFDRVRRVTQPLQRDLYGLSEIFKINTQDLGGYTSFIREYESEIDKAVEKNSVLGNSQTLLSDKINITKTALEQAVNQFGASSVEVEELRERLAGLTEQQATLNAEYERFSNFGEAIADGIQTFGEALSTTLKDGAISFKSFARAALDAISTVIGALIKQGVAAAVSNALKDSIIFGPASIAIGAATGTAAAALFRGLLSAISAPKLAGGGIIPPGFEGDRFPAFLNSGEAVIPLDRLFKELNGGGGEIQGIVRGQDLLLIMDRASANRSRITGL